MMLDYGHLLDPGSAHGMRLLPGLKVGYSKIAVHIIQGFFCMVFLAFMQLEKRGGIVGGTRDISKTLLVRRSLVLAASSISPDVWSNGAVFG